MSEQPLTPREIEQRTAEAAFAEQQGKHRTAARLYQQLGTDIQARNGRFDTRALDAFEAMSRLVSDSAESDWA